MRIDPARVGGFFVALIACAPGPVMPRTDAGPRDAGPHDAGRPRDAGFDAGADAGPCAPLAVCGATCADLSRDPLHCSACDTPCTAPANASPTCVASSCDFACDAGYVREGAACALAPRPIWPPSLSTVRGPRPTLRWIMPAELVTATLELCADPACASVIEAIDAATEATPAADLPAGPVYWRVTSSGRMGPTWRFDVTRRDAGAPNAWGTIADYDRDGYDDVAIGAPYAASMDGRVALHLGSSGGISAGASAVLRGADAEEFGIALACAGDLDGDGFADLAVGGPAAERVTIFFGSDAGIPETGARTIVLAGPADGGSRFGGAIAGLGDVDGDGFGDLAIAAIGEGTTLGRVHVYRGEAGGVALTPARTIVGTGRYAAAIAGAGDVNGDGFADLVVGAYAAGSMSGAVHLFLGAAEGIAATATQTIAGATAGGQLGFSVAGAGDLNGDGLADVVVGAPAAVMSRGDVLIFYGTADGVSAAPITVSGINAGGGFFGHSVAGLGDGDGDGFDDLAVGAFGVNDRAGRVSVFLGGDGALVTTTRTTVDGPFGANGDFGWAIAGGVDVDGNGRHDLVVGAPGVDARAGRAYVFRGAATTGINPMNPVSLLGASGGAFGRAVANATR